MRSLLLTLILLLSLGASSLAEGTWPCTPCNSTGKCSICWGSGKDTYGVDCTWCKGSKKCWYCSGEGHI